MALHHAQTAEVVHIGPLGENFSTAQSIAITKNRGFETVRLVLPVNSNIPTHAVPGNVILHCLEGNVQLGLPDSSVTLNSHDWVYLEPKTPHSLKAIENSTLLLTILFNPGPQIKPSQSKVLDRWENEGGAVNAYTVPPT